MTHQVTPSSDSSIPLRWLPLVRLLWFMFALLLIAGYVLGVPAYFRELNQLCVTELCYPYTLTALEESILTGWGISLNAYATYIIFSDLVLVSLFFVPAFIIFWRKSQDWIGVLASLAFLFIGFIVMAEEIRALVRAFPALFPISEFLISLGVVFFMLTFYLFPDGRFVPRQLKIPVIIMSVIILLLPFFPGEGPRSISGNLFVTALGMSNVVLGFFSQIYRYRRISSPTQRQQTKWVFFGFIILFIAAMYWTFLAEFNTLPAGRPRLYFNLTALVQAIGLSMFPISVLIAILRYRLWDIDILIRRTLVYAVLTFLLLMVYFGSVVLVQGVINGITGREETNQLTIVLSTLLIAALFNPLRHRVQEFIDRRFYRRKYDATRTLTRFAANARDNVDLDALTKILLNVVEDTMQPEYISFWFKEPQKGKKR